MPTTLAFDIGLAHTGVAISYENQIAEGLLTIHTASADRLRDEILKLVTQYKPEVIVIGIPEKGPVNDYVADLKNHLEPLIDIPIKLVNEDLTSQMALRAMISANKGPKQRHLTDHQAAAASILQLYLDDLVE